VKQTSENKLFNPSLSLFAPNQARESGESKQSVPSDQISEPATMALFVNAMTYLPPSSYLPVDLVLRPHANSEPATMASRKLTSSMSKSTSEPASMAPSVNAMTYLPPSPDLPVNRSTSRSRATSEPASMATLSHIVSLLQ